MTEENKGFSRRTVVKGAAWSVPVIAAAVATPLAAASVNNASVTWDGTSASLASIALLDGTTATVGAGVLLSVPNNIVVQNGPGAIVGPITGLVTITHASGIPVGIGGAARGFAVTNIPGATLGTRTITQKTLLVVIPGVIELAVDETSQPFTVDSPSLASSAQAILGQVEYALTNRALLGLGVLMTFNVTVSLFDNGTLIDQSAVAQINVPLGAGVI